MKPLYLVRLAILTVLLLGWNWSSFAQTQTFVYSGAVMQTFSINAGTFSVSVDVQGAKGGNDEFGYGTGGSGGRVQAILATTPGQVLNIFVGGVGANGTGCCSITDAGGFNGGGNGYNYGAGGGGASDIRVGGTALANRLVVAAGGGGSGYYMASSNGGAGGGLSGGNGLSSGSYNSSYNGTGGSQTAGGISGTSSPGSSGTLGQGGNAYSGGYSGGGGGGYYGGGGAAVYNGGGGGSSYTDPTLVTGQTLTAGYNAGNGVVTITQICTPPSNGVINGTTSVCGTGVNSALTTTASIGGVWSSSNPGVATITNTGVVTSMAVGTTTISYNVTYACGSPAYATAVFQVNAIPTAIFPTTTTTVCAGQNITLNDATPGGNFSSGNLLLASVNPTTGVVTGLAGGNPTISYTIPYSGCYATASITVNPTPVGISGTPTVCVGAATTLTDITPGGTWTTSSGSLATVTSGGVVTGVNPGTPNIIYTLTSTGCSTSIPVTVNAMPPANTVTGGGGYCTGGTGSDVRLLTNSTIGVGYQLYNGSTPVGGPLAGTGGILDYGLQTAVGTYSVTAINTTTGCTRGLSGSATISLNPLPVAYPVSISGGGAFCDGGAGVDFILSNSETGNLYQLYYNGAAASGVSPMLGATGSSIDFGYLTTPGVYTVLGFNASTGCSNFMSGSGTVVVNPLPAVQNVTGGGNYCAGSAAGAHIYLDNSVPGISYQLYNNISPVGSPMAGTGAEIDFGGQTAVGTNYNVVATNAITGCSTPMAGTASIGVNSLPNAYPVAGGGPRCFGTAGVDISLPASDFGVNYQLMMGGMAVGAPVAGGASPLDLGTYFTGGTYNVIATDATSGCTNNMGGTATILVNPLPVVQSITGGGSYCNGGTGRNVGLGNSEMNVDYELFNNGVTTSMVMPGTGTAISFGPETNAGNYTVVATNHFTGCTSDMSGTAPVIVNPLPAVDSVNGGGSYCAGGTGVHVGLNFSDVGVNYQLMNGATMVGSPVAGLGSSLDFGSLTNAGTYSVLATNALTGCTSTQAGTQTIVVNPLPNTFAVTGGGSFCAGSTGVPVGISNSNTGINYQLMNGSTMVSALSGTGTSLNFGIQTNPGVYTIVASNATTGCNSNFPGNATISVNPLPAAFTITGGGNYCAGATGVHIGLAGTNTGVSYQLMNGATPVGTAVAGTGSTLDFGIETTPGVYTVAARNNTTGCSSTMPGSSAVVVNPLPASYTVTGGGNYCAGTGGVHIGLSNSATGVNYQLYNGATPVGSVVPGVAGTSVDFGTQTATGTYTVKATNSLTSCASNMSSSVNVGVNPVPAVYTVTGGGTFCQGSTGVHVGLTGSVSGFNYQLVNSTTGMAVGSAVAGTGSTVDFGMQSASGNYTVVASNPATMCTSNMIGAATVTANPVPSAYDVTGGGSYCAGGTGVLVGLIGSGYGINYQLYNGTTPTGLPIGGTGAPLNFGLQTTAGTYMIKAINTVTGCSSNMTGAAPITITPTVVPSVTVMSAMGNTVCEGTANTFTATPVNGGSTPAFQWKVNGANVGAGSSYSYVPSNGDVVTAVLTSSAACPSVPSVDNSLTISVLNYVLPTASITSNMPSTVCPATNVTYSATTTNGGNAPVYTWLKNNVDVATGLTYSTVPVNGDIISFRLVSDKQCRSTDSVFSNDIAMNVITPIVPVFTVTSHLGPLGVGQTDTFRANVTNAGISTLIYQWFVNGRQIPGASSSKFVADSVFNNDSVMVVVTSMGECGGGSASKTVGINLTNLAVKSVTSMNSDIKVMPNPNNGTFTIKGSLGTTDNVAVTMEVTNMVGQVIYTNKVNAINGNINELVQLNSIANGMYILNLRTESGNMVYHVVIEQ